MALQWSSFSFFVVCFLCCWFLFSRCFSCVSRVVIVVAAAVVVGVFPGMARKKKKRRGGDKATRKSCKLCLAEGADAHLGDQITELIHFQLPVAVLVKLPKEFGHVLRRVAEVLQFPASLADQNDAVSIGPGLRHGVAQH